MTSTVDSSPSTGQKKPWAGFFNLPRELRDMVYDLVLVVPQHERMVRSPYMIEHNLPATEENQHRMIWRPKVALEVTWDGKVFMERDPPLLSVCRKMRNEGDEAYWGRNEWRVLLDVKQSNDGYPSIDEDLHAPMQQLEKWVRTVGIHRLRHLRDFRITANASHQLTVNLPRIPCPPINIDTAQMRRHIARAHWKMNGERWIGEGIVHVFLANPNFWKTWFFSSTPMGKEQKPDVLDARFDRKWFGWQEDPKERSKGKNDKLQVVKRKAMGVQNKFALLALQEGYEGDADGEE